VITGITRKDFVLLATPLAVTETSAKPAARLPGTATTILVSLQKDTVPGIPANVTVSGVAPKPEPVIVTDPPTGLTGPTVGDIPVMLGTAWARLTIDVSKKKSAIFEKTPIEAFIFIMNSDFH
jgi:hypothetical protein